MAGQTMPKGFANTASGEELTTPRTTSKQIPAMAHRRECSVEQSSKTHGHTATAQHSGLLTAQNEASC
jgi:hypothetical protein